jgi:hypothetical protein
MDRRILELAVEALENRRAVIDAEIEMVQAELGGGTTPIETAAMPSPKGRRTRTPAERERHSEVMRRVWAARKAEAGKAEAAKPSRAKKTAPGKRKYGPQSAEAKAAISRRMKAYWKKRTAAEAKK